MQSYDMPKDAAIVLGCGDVVSLVAPGDDASAMTVEQITANVQRDPVHGWRFTLKDGQLCVSLGHPQIQSDAKIVLSERYVVWSGAPEPRRRGRRQSLRRFTRRGAAVKS
jgi:hypothetical protein